MKTKIVYTLVSGPQDFYALQALVSVMSLRHHCPDAYVELVCDTSTRDYIESLPLPSMVDDIVCKNFSGELTSKEISRRLKTQLRSLVRGDFLYIDTDTIITSPLEEIDNFEGSLYAVADAHCQLGSNPYMSMIRQNAKRLGYGLAGESSFFNGGVILAKDDAVANLFYEKWHNFYECGTRKGIFIDQPSFAQANIALGHPMEEMPGIWNCQLRHGAKFLKDAKIVHYLWTAKRAQNPFVLGRQDVWNEIRSTGSIPEYVKELFDDPFKGLQGLTYLASTEETAILNSRSYKVMCKFEQESPLFNSMFRFCVRALDFIYKIIGGKYGRV